MGYRSNVTYVVPADEYENIMAAYRQYVEPIGASLPEPEFTERVEPNTNSAYPTIPAMVFGWKGIKWYTEEPEIGGFVELVDDYCRQRNLSYQMIRLGEDDDDVETDGNYATPDALAATLYVERRIAVSYA